MSRTPSRGSVRTITAATPGWSSSDSRYSPYPLPAQGSSRGLHATGVDEPHPECYLLGARDLQSLPLLDGLDKAGSFLQRLVRPGVEPCHAASHELQVQVAALHVREVDVGDLELAARRRLQRARDVHHVGVVEVEAGHGVMRLRPRRLLLDSVDLASRRTRRRRTAPGPSRSSRRSSRPAAALRRAASSRRGRGRRRCCRPARARHRSPPMKSADDERLREPFRSRLGRIGNGSRATRRRPSRSSKRGRSRGVEMTRMSRIPASMSVDSG
jgi:hypothetical protein